MTHTQTEATTKAPARRKKGACTIHAPSSQGPGQGRDIRIRRCNGNKAAWLLVAISADGSESDSFGSYTTAMSIDGLLKSPAAQHLLVGNPKIELIAT